MISLNDLIKASNGQLFGEPAAHLFSDFCLDPVQAGEDRLFVAMRTDKGDTHQYIDEAIQRGVSGVICVNPPSSDTTGVTVLMVSDPVDALMAWSRTVIGRLGVRVIAVAGSATRSVTAEAIYQVLKTQHNVYYHDVGDSGVLSVPLSLAQLRSEHQIAILKLAINEPGEMAQMVQAIQPDVSVITQIDCVHNDHFESCEHLIYEMSLLVEYLSPTKLAVLNLDDDYTHDIAARARAEVKTIGVDSFGADLMAFNVLIGSSGTGFDLRYGGERFIGRWSPLLSRYQLYSMLYAILVGTHYGIDVERSLNVLKNMTPLNGRMKPLNGKNHSLLIDDSYNANVISTFSLLDWMQKVRDEVHRMVLVMGDMDDMGANNQFGHRLVGQNLNGIVDVLITKGTQSALIGRSAIDQGLDARYVHMTYSIQDVIATLENIGITEDDIVVVKGGYTTEMERVARHLLAVDDDAEQLVRQDVDSSQINVAQLTRPSWVEIDTDVFAKNVRITKDWIGEDVELMAVVKANGYGHGAVTCARTALLNGASYLGVASIAEALELREGGITAPILVMTYAPVNTIRQAMQEDITFTVFDLEMARAYDRAARDIEGHLKVHVKIDTGMGRLGLLTGEAISVFRHLRALTKLDIEGVYTHFSVADEDGDYTADQVDAFRNVVRPLRAAGFQFKHIHAANSSGVLSSADNHFSMVRPGLMLYGLCPSELHDFPSGLRPVMAWKTSVVQVKTLPPGSYVGYGNTYLTADVTKIAILPVGYADGLRRSPKTWKQVLVNGQRAPLIGRVSMEKCAVNVTHIPTVAVGDEVVLLGRQGDDEITADEIAEWLGTINYEVVTNILPGVPRY